MTRTLVCDGGGMKGAFMAGVMAGLHEQGVGTEFFDNYVGTSVGAFSMVYFMTGQIEEGLRIWQDCIPNGFIKWRSFKPQVDLNYLKSILVRLEPLNIHKIKYCAQKAYVALTNSVTQETEYILLNGADNIIDILMASVALPSYGSPYRLNGQEYYDAGLTSQPPLDFADRLQSEEIWVILNRPLGYRVTTVGWKAMSLLVNDPHAKKLIASKPWKINKILIELEKRTDLKIICPQSKLPLHWLTTSRNDIKNTIELGRLAAAKFNTQKKATHEVVVRN